MPNKLALYFGYGNGGPFLRGLSRASLSPQQDCPGFPWEIQHLDTGLLNNRGVPDAPDGRVHWTCGGKPVLWHAFFWWDRSGDSRSGSNSGFYVRGFEDARREGFDFACAAWPQVVERQRFALVLVDS